MPWREIAKLTYTLFATGRTLETRAYICVNHEKTSSSQCKDIRTSFDGNAIAREASSDAVIEPSVLWS